MNDNVMNGSTSHHTNVGNSRMSGRRGSIVGSFTFLAMVLASSCSPFPDRGEDISADVGIAGAVSSKTGEAGNSESPPSTERMQTPAVAQGEATPPDDEKLTPSTIVDAQHVGRSTTYLGIEVELGDFIVTNQSLDEYTAGKEPSDDERILVVEVAVTNAGTGTIAVPSDVFGIELAGGERVAVDDMLAPDGDFVGTIRPATQSTERVLLSFDDVELSGASFVISEAGAIPQYIPLDDLPVPPPYEMTLGGRPAVTDLLAPSPWDSCEYLWTGEALGARIVLDGVDGSNLERAAKGTRWLAVELRATNNTGSSNDFYPCNSTGMAIFDLNPRLQIDGVAMSPSNSVAIGPRIDENVSASVELWFPIPTDTVEVDLTDVHGTVIATWALELPAVPGEG